MILKRYLKAHILKIKTVTIKEVAELARIERLRRVIEDDSEDGKIGYLIVGINNEVLDFTIYKNKEKAKKKLTVLKREFSNASIIAIDIDE